MPWYTPRATLPRFDAFDDEGFQFAYGETALGLAAMCDASEEAISAIAPQGSITFPDHIYGAVTVRRTEDA